MFAAASWKKIAFIACEDIGVFAAKALQNSTDDRFKNKTIDLSAGEYGIEDVSDAIHKSQGYVPWLAWYAPTLIRKIMPYDFKQMFTCESGLLKTLISSLCRGRIRTYRRRGVEEDSPGFAVVRGLVPQECLGGRSTMPCIC